MGGGGYRVGQKRKERKRGGYKGWGGKERWEVEGIGERRGGR